MKKLLFMTALAVGVVFSSCEDQTDPLDLTTLLDAESEASLEASYDDVDEIVDAGMDVLNYTPSDRLVWYEIIECAEVTKDTASRTVTIDYGDGCYAAGRTLKGKVIIEYSNQRFVPGATRKATLVDFYVDDTKVEGVRTLTNTSESTEANPQFTVTLEGGKVTFADATFATRTATKTRTWVRAANPLNDQWVVTGSASGLRRDGTSYAMEITEQLVHKRSCRRDVWIPAQGIKEVSWEGNTAVMDYGDGTCDNVVTITINGGEPFDKEIYPRGRK